MQYLSTEQAAKRLGINRRTALRLCQARKITFVNIGTEDRPRIRISEEAIEAYMNARTSEAVA